MGRQAEREFAQVKGRNIKARHIWMGLRKLKTIWKNFRRASVCGWGGKETVEEERGERRKNTRAGWCVTKAGPGEQALPHLPPSFGPAHPATTPNCPLCLHSFQQGDLIPDHWYQCKDLFFVKSVFFFLINWMWFNLRRQLPVIEKVQGLLNNPPLPGPCKASAFCPLNSYNNPQVAFRPHTLLYRLCSGPPKTSF